jgi:hypothetical protein
VPATIAFGPLGAIGSPFNANTWCKPLKVSSVTSKSSMPPVKFFEGLDLDLIDLFLDGHYIVKIDLKITVDRARLLEKWVLVKFQEIAFIGG